MILCCLWLSDMVRSLLVDMIKSVYRFVKSGYNMQDEQMMLVLFAYSCGESGLKTGRGAGMQIRGGAPPGN